MTFPIDLHAHSTASDGALTPTLLVQRAFDKGLKVLALTDHDTIEGLEEAQSTAKQLGIHLIPGIELSCVWAGITIHILGYDFNTQSVELKALLNTMYEARWLRAQKIADKLQQKGMGGLFEAACAYKKELSNTQNAPGRPHFAEVMLRKGYVQSHKEAFQKWLGNGKIGDVKQHWPELVSIVQVLKNSGAWISLAHPLQYKMTRSKMCHLLRDFISEGGQAIEVVNGFQVDVQVGKLSNLCRDFGLLASAGSDFHTPQAWGELGLYRQIPEDLPRLYDRWPAIKQLLENS